MDQLNTEKFKCPKCKDDKVRGEFGICNGQRNTWCKNCCAAAVRHCYANNILYRESQKAAHDRRALRNHRYLYAYLRSHPCVDCGETDPLILQFDHVIERTKKNDVTGHILNCIARMQEEIDLCVVRCCNCHAKKTAKVFNTIRFQICKEVENKGTYLSIEELLQDEEDGRNRRNRGKANPFFQKVHTEEAKAMMRASLARPQQARLF